ncbi:MAG TPA: FtsX-like permease family protein [Pirellulales bacterium]|jgi:putative ABC transport system permease protein|nr:FtsX-like permease family protein [Pirellulales bacterium]
MHFLQLVLRNLWRRKLRSTLTCLGVTMAVASTVALVGFSRGLEHSTVEVYKAHGIDLVAVRTGVTQQITSSLNESAGDRIRRVPGVHDVNPSQTDLVSLGDGGLVGIPLHGWPVDGFAMQSLNITAGRRLTDRDTWGVLLGAGLAASLDKQVGQQLEIESQNFKVVGIFAGLNVYENMTAVARLADVQQLMDRPGQVTELQIALDAATADDAAALAAVRREIENVRDERGEKLGLSAVPARQFVESSTEVGLARAMAWGTTALALVIGSLQLLNTMLMSVIERIQEIGVLVALGWRTSRVVRMVLYEALALSAVGATAGILLGVTLVRWLSSAAWMGGLLVPEVSPEVLVASLVVALVMGAVGGSYPAWRAARLSAAQALRYE